MVELAIQTLGLKKRYGKVEALAGVDLSVPRGAVVALIGPNGAGKTTLLSLLCGYMLPDAGEVRVLGGPPDPMRLKGRLLALPQDAMLSRALPVRTELEHFGRLQGLSPAKAKSEALRVLEQFDLLDLGGRNSGALSHGQAKRVGIAQVFIGDPEILLVDEPTAGLDPVHARQVRDAIEAVGGKKTVVVSSHNLDELERMCDHVVFLEQGRLSETGTLASMTEEDAHISIELGLAASETSEPPLAHAALEERLKVVVADLFPQATAALRSPPGQHMALYIRLGPTSASRQAAVTELLRGLLSHPGLAHLQIYGVTRGIRLEDRYFEKEETKSKAP